MESVQLGAIGLLFVVCVAIVYVVAVRKKAPKQFAYATILVVAGGLLSSGAEILLGLGVIANKFLVSCARMIAMASFAGALWWTARVIRASNRAGHNQ